MQCFKKDLQANRELLKQAAQTIAKSEAIRARCEALRLKHLELAEKYTQVLRK